MRRLLEQALVAWKGQKDRKPVLLDGARQVGKSYLIERLFGPSQFARVHRLDLRETPVLHGLFGESLDPENRPRKTLGTVAGLLLRRGYA